MRELIKEHNTEKKCLQLLGGARYTVRGISEKGMMDKDFSLAQFEEALDFFNETIQLMK